MKTRSTELTILIEKFGSRYAAMKPKQVTEFNKESAAEMAETKRSWRQ